MEKRKRGRPTLEQQEERRVYDMKKKLRMMYLEKATSLSSLGTKSAMSESRKLMTKVETLEGDLGKMDKREEREQAEELKEIKRDQATRYGSILKEYPDYEGDGSEVKDDSILRKKTHQEDYEEIEVEPKNKWYKKVVEKRRVRPDIEL